MRGALVWGHHGSFLMMLPEALLRAPLSGWLFVSLPTALLNFCAKTKTIASVAVSNARQLCKLPAQVGSGVGCTSPGTGGVTSGCTGSGGGTFGSVAILMPWFRWGQTRAAQNRPSCAADHGSWPLRFRRHRRTARLPHWSARLHGRACRPRVDWEVSLGSWFAGFGTLRAD